MITLPLYFTFPDNLFLYYLGSVLFFLELSLLFSIEFSLYSKIQGHC